MQDKITFEELCDGNDYIPDKSFLCENKQSLKSGIFLKDICRMQPMIAFSPNSIPTLKVIVFRTL